jgi:hypothetical protein
MKSILKIAVISLILFASCQKSVDQPYTLKFYGDAYEDIGYSATIVSDGYVIAGQLEKVTRDGVNTPVRNKNLGIIKTGWDGNEIWKVSTGGRFDDMGSKINQLDDGSLICVGTLTDTTTATAVQTDVFVVKVSSTGTIEWQKAYGGAGNQTGTDVVKTTGGFIILGSTDVGKAGTDSTGNISGNTDIFLLKIKDNGDLIESFAYGYPGNDIGKVIKPDQGGNFMIFGTTDRSDPGQGNNNLLLIRINSAGYLTQTKIIGGTEDEYAGDMEVLADGYLLAYTVGRDGDDQKIYVTKLKNDIYATAYFKNNISITNPNSTDNSAAVYALSKYKTDSFLLAGQSGKSTGSSAKMLIFEMDASGNLVEGHQMIKGSTGTQVAYDVVSGDDEYIIAVGKNSYDVNSMITFLKFKF